MSDDNPMTLPEAAAAAAAAGWERHPANSEPAWPAGDFDRLAASMAARGFVPEVGGRIVLDAAGLVIAGWHRLLAVIATGGDPRDHAAGTGGIPPGEIVEMSDRTRRHTQRTDSILADLDTRRCMKGIKTRDAVPRHGAADLDASRDYSHAGIAERHGVNVDSVRRLDRIRDPRLIAAVRTGNAGAKTAAALDAAADPERDGDLLDSVAAGERTAGAAARVARQRSAAPAKRPHPATYSAGMMAQAAMWLTGTERVIDPFAGSGGVFALLQFHPGLTVRAVDIEPVGTWEGMDARVEQGDATSLRWPAGSFGAAVTSPVYGNKMSVAGLWADAAGRDDYTSRAGRELADGNAARYRWRTAEYRSLHERSWAEARRVLRPGSPLILFLRDSISEGRPQEMIGLHARILTGLGFHLATVWAIATPGNRRGQGTSNAAGSGECMMVWRRSVIP